MASATFLFYGDVIQSENKNQINIFGDNTEMPGISSKEIINFLDQNKNADELVIRINSRGGSTQEGFLIYDLLVNSGKKITTIGEGKIYSIATVIFLAGQKRIMLENADGLIHMPFIPPYTLADQYNSEDLENLSELLKQEEEKILQFYVDKTGYDKEKLRDYMKNETFLSASDMVSLGFAHEIQVPLKAVAYVNFNNKKMAEHEELKTMGEKIDAFIAKASDFFNSFSRINLKNMDITDVNGNQFHVVREEGEMQVGDEASPDGSYTLENGKTVKIESGKITEIMEPKQEESEEAKALKTENEALKAEIAALKETQNKLNSDIETFNQKKTEVETLITELKNLKSTVTIDGRKTMPKQKTNSSGAVDWERVKEIANK